MSKGIDISKYQAGLDLSVVKDAGYDFAILRAGYTGYGNGTSKAKDSSFEKFYTQAKSVGLGVGAYWFTCANTYEKGVSEANWMYENCLKGKQFEYPIYIDVEDDTGKKYYLRNAGKEAVNQGIKGFCETLEAKGYYVGIYASDISGFKELMDVSGLTDYDKWVARYGSKPSYVTEYGMHQYTSSGKISGYSGNLDMNESYKDYPSIIKNGGFNGYSKNSGGTSDNTNTGASNNTSSSETITYTVKKGDTLSEIAEKYGTTYQKLAEINGIADPDKIYAGQVIKINGSSSSTSVKTHRVVKGENLSTIAKKYGTTWQKIYNDNKDKIGSNPNIIQPGTTLVIK